MGCPPREYDDPAEAEFMTARRGPQPMATFAEAVHLGTPLDEQPFERTYLRATADSPDTATAAAFDRAARHAAQSPAWHHHEIATNHMVASNRPQELVDLLLPL